MWLQNYALRRDSWGTIPAVLSTPTTRVAPIFFTAFTSPVAFAIPIAFAAAFTKLYVLGLNLAVLMLDQVQRYHLPLRSEVLSFLHPYVFCPSFIFLLHARQNGMVTDVATSVNDRHLRELI